MNSCNPLCVKFLGTSVTSLQHQTFVWSDSTCFVIQTSHRTRFLFINCFLIAIAWAASAGCKHTNQTEPSPSSVASLGWHRKKSASGECLAFLVVDVMRACLHMKRCVLLVQQVRMCRIWRCTSVWISRHTESSSFRRSLAHHLRYLLVAHTGDNMHLLGLFAWSFVRAVNAKTIPCQEISHFDSKSKAQIKKLYFSLRSFDLLGALQFYLRCDIITSGQLSAFSIVLIRILIFAIHFLLLLFYL